jgi:hypothetical protein
MLEYSIALDLQMVLKNQITDILWIQLKAWTLNDHQSDVMGMGISLLICVSAVANQFYRRTDALI